MVGQKELTKIEEIVWKVYRHHFGDHPVEIRLELGNDFLYGDDLVDIYIIFDVLPEALGGPDWENFRGRKSVDFKFDIGDLMAKEELPIDPVFWYRSPEDLEPALSDA